MIKRACPYHAEHGGAVVGCNECGIANAVIPTGRCRCLEPVVERLGLWAAAQCLRCGREVAL